MLRLTFPVLSICFVAAACDRKSSDQPSARPDSSALTVSAVTAPADSLTLPDVGQRHGWLAASVGNVAAFDNSVPDTSNIFRVELFPADSAARAIAPGDTLRLVTAYKTYSAAVLEIVNGNRPNKVSVVSLNVHAPGLALGAEWPMAWVVPAGAPAVQGVQLSQHSPGDSARHWTGDGHRLFILGNPRIAELIALPVSGTPTPILAVKVDPAMDRANGFERDSVLDYRGPDPRVPEVLEGFRFGRKGPWIFVVLVYGYECTNLRLVQMDQQSARLLEDDLHYYACVV